MFMSKIKMAFKLVEDLKSLAASIENLANAMKANESLPQVAEKPVEEPVTVEKVRAVLAEKSRAGKQEEVKALIARYGASKLTDIEPVHYPKILAEAEAL